MYILKINIKGYENKFYKETLKETYDQLNQLIYENMLNQYDEIKARILLGSAEKYYQTLDSKDWDNYNDLILDKEDKIFKDSSDKENQYQLINRFIKEFNLKADVYKLED